MQHEPEFASDVISVFGIKGKNDDFLEGLENAEVGNIDEIGHLESTS